MDTDRKLIPLTPAHREAVISCFLQLGQDIEDTRRILAGCPYGAGEFRELQSSELVLDKIVISNLIFKFMDDLHVPQFITEYTINQLVKYGFATQLRTGNFIVSKKMLIETDSDALRSIIGGKQFIVEKLRMSTSEIIVRSASGDEFTGSGFLIRDSKYNFYIGTCHHNIFEADGSMRAFRIYLDGSMIKIGNVFCYENIDYCKIHVPVMSRNISLILSEIDILDNIIVSGYPRVSLIQRSPLIFTSGAINGVIKDETGVTTGAIISANTAPGSSGGPVVNDFCHLVGMIDQQKIMKHETGQAEFNHIITSDMILSAERTGSSQILSPKIF